MAGAAAAARASWIGQGRISSPADVELALAVHGGAGRAGTGALRRPVTVAGELVERGPVGYQPVHPLLAPLLPWSGGLRRGSVVTVTGSTSLLVALLAPVIGQGGYAGVVGRPELGLAAASEHVGLELARLALVPAPGPDWPAVVAALVDGLDMVAVNVPGDVSAGLARSLAARARRTGAVLVPLTRSWSGADLVLTGETHEWAGLGVGRGRLREHRLRVSSTGRGAAARRREVVVSMPLPDPAGLPVRQAPVSAGDLVAVRRSA
jgi:hypothetical protein